MGTESDIAGPAPDGHTLPAPGGDAAGEAFVYAGADGGEVVGYIGGCGDIYDSRDRRVGHVAIAETGQGRIYRGDDREAGWVTLTPYSGLVRSHDDPHLLGIVRATGEVYVGDHLAPVGYIRPPTNVHLMAGAALLLGLVRAPVIAQVAR